MFLSFFLPAMGSLLVHSFIHSYPQKIVHRADCQSSVNSHLGYRNDLLLISLHIMSERHDRISRQHHDYQGHLKVTILCRLVMQDSKPPFLQANVNQALVLKNAFLHLQNWAFLYIWASSPPDCNNCATRGAYRCAWLYPSKATVLRQ